MAECLMEYVWIVLAPAPTLGSLEKLKECQTHTFFYLEATTESSNLYYVEQDVSFDLSVRNEPLHKVMEQGALKIDYSPAT